MPTRPTCRTTSTDILASELASLAPDCGILESETPCRSASGRSRGGWVTNATNRPKRVDVTAERARGRRQLQIQQPRRSKARRRTAAAQRDRPPRCPGGAAPRQQVVSASHWGHVNEPARRTGQARLQVDACVEPASADEAGGTRGPGSLGQRPCIPSSPRRRAWSGCHGSFRNCGICGKRFRELNARVRPGSREDGRQGRMTGQPGRGFLRTACCAWMQDSETDSSAPGRKRLRYVRTLPVKPSTGNCACRPGKSSVPAKPRPSKGTQASATKESASSEIDSGETSEEPVLFPLIVGAGLCHATSPAPYLP